MAPADDLALQALEYDEQLKKAQVEVEATLAKLNDEHGFARQKVADHFNILALELDNRKQYLLEELHKVHEYKVKRLEEQLQALEKLQGDMHELTVRIREAQAEEHAQDAEFFTVQLEKVVGIGAPLSAVEDPKFQYTLNRQRDVEVVHSFGLLEVQPEVTGTAFVYKGDFDTNGILYWIGCNYGTSEYQNPADIGLVSVKASSCEYGNVNHAVAHHKFSSRHQTFMTESTPGSWLIVHLGVHYVVCPTAYTLKNCVINPCHALANWNFQGSTDGESWTTLRSHIDDKMLLPGRGSVWTWPIEGCKQYFNRFRILMTGPNQHTQPHAKFHYLMVAGMEIYGYVDVAPGMEW